MIESIEHLESMPIVDIETELIAFIYLKDTPFDTLDIELEVESSNNYYYGE